MAGQIFIGHNASEVPLRFLAFVFLIFLLPGGTGLDKSGVEATVQDPDLPELHAVMLSPEIDVTWRYTKEGWQDSSTWAVGPTGPRFKRSIENVHPFVITVLILFCVLIVTVWSSNEWQVSRLTGLESKTAFMPEKPSIESDEQAHFN
ncbi:MAG: hypothetical protein AAF939_12105 [Planctomycetota bacterium]